MRALVCARAFHGFTAARLEEANGSVSVRVHVCACLFSRACVFVGLSAHACVRVLVCACVCARLRVRRFTAARLEEANGNVGNVGKILERALRQVCV